MNDPVEPAEPICGSVNEAHRLRLCFQIRSDVVSALSRKFRPPGRGLLFRSDDEFIHPGTEQAECNRPPDPMSSSGDENAFLDQSTDGL
jgi:hypothetical protein